MPTSWPASTTILHCSGKVSIECPRMNHDVGIPSLSNSLTMRGTPTSPANSPREISQGESCPPYDPSRPPHPHRPRKHRGSPFCRPPATGTNVRRWRWPAIPVPTQAIRAGRPDRWASRRWCRNSLNLNWGYSAAEPPVKKSSWEDRCASLMTRRHPNASACIVSRPFVDTETASRDQANLKPPTLPSLNNDA